MATLKYGLNIQRKSQGRPQRPAPPKKKPLFGNDDSDDDETPKDGAQEEEIGVFDLDAPAKKSTRPGPPKKPVSQPKPKGKPSISQYGDLSSMKNSKKHMEEAEALDPSIYDYDAAYDALHAKSEAKKAAEREDAQQRKPKYMENLLAAAEVRKRDQLKAQDALLQREREAEGDEFADKEQFVTGAYKQQQEEVQRAAAEEEKRREEEEKRRKTGQGLQSFRRNMLNTQDQKHQDAMDAVEEAAKRGPAESKAEEPKEKTDLDLANELNAKGKNVIINEEGQVADKRQLLSAGLNVSARPKPPPSTAQQRPTGPQQAYQGRSSTQKGVRERQTRMMEEQLQQAAKRAADEEAEEQRKIEHASKSRKTEGDISSAKERYLQRKKEAAEAKARGK